MVLTTWELEAATVDAFLEVMREVRLIRLRTGAHRWRLYRDAADPHRLTEVFLVVSWEEHLAQHGRIDDASAMVLRRARDLDRSGRPHTRHLVAVDVARPGDWDALVAAHARYHHRDGAFPLGGGSGS